MKRFLLTLVILATLASPALVFGADITAKGTTVVEMLKADIKVNDKITTPDKITWAEKVTETITGPDDKDMIIDRTQQVKGTIQHHRLPDGTWRTVMDIDGTHIEGTSVKKDGDMITTVNKITKEVKE